MLWAAGMFDQGDLGAGSFQLLDEPRGLRRGGQRVGSADDHRDPLVSWTPTARSVLGCSHGPGSTARLWYRT